MYSCAIYVKKNLSIKQGNVFLQPKPSIMKFDEIITISGKPGLYRLISSNKSRVVVSSLTDQKKTSISVMNQVSSLETIAIYTLTEEVPLSEILFKIFEREVGKKCLSHKEPVENLQAYFEGILPDYDAERVYNSHIKKVLQWYNILVEANFDFNTLKPETDEPTSSGEE